MNFLAHVLVAAESGDDSPEAGLGAALPDLARMAGLRFDRDALPPLVRQGVDSHHRADSCFHADRTFLVGAAALRSAAQRGGLPVGASRAVGHVGWELLLDGALLGVPGLVDRFLAATACAAVVVPALEPADRASWAGLVVSLRTDRWWLRYDEPVLVANSLFRMVQARPRLRFGADQLPLVVELLTAAAPSVAREAEPTVQAVVAGLRRPPTG